MKRILILLSILTVTLGLVRCKEEPSSDLPLKQPELFQVETGEAIDVAQAYLKVGLDSAESKGNARTAATSDSSRKVTDIKTIRDPDRNPLMYVISFSEKNSPGNNPASRGSIVVSADKRVVPILAKTETGSIDPDGDNPGLKIWFDYVSKTIMAAKARRSEPSDGVKALWSRYGKDYLKLKNGRTTDCTDPPCPDDPCPADYFYQSPVLLTTNWGQWEPYNMFCPSSGANACQPCGQSTAGCAAVAIAQVFNRYKKPATYTLAPAGPVNYVYPLANAATTTNCVSAHVRDREIAALIRCAGMWINTHYAFNKCSSYSWREQTKNAFASAGYSKSGNRVSWGSNYQAVGDELKNGHPVIIDATTGFLQFNDWHIWVVDGYQQYITYNKADPQNPFSSCLSYEYAYFHLNWGWEGDDNGWYGLSNFTGDGEEYDYDMNVTLGMRP